MPRKLLLQLHISLDGYIAGPNHSLMDWITFSFDDELNTYIGQQIMGRVDHILLGRKLAEGFIPAWRSRPASELGVKEMNELPKTVFSTTLKESPWGEGTQLVGGYLTETVEKLRAEKGRKDVIAYGGVQMAQSLVAAGLVDEIFLLVQPVALGEGARLFTTRMDWEIAEARKFDCGIVAQHLKAKV